MCVYVCARTHAHTKLLFYKVVHENSILYIDLDLFINQMIENLSLILLNK